jgi:putative acetyltransferase
MFDQVEFRVDDLSGEAVRKLIALHLRRMRATSPPESSHALDIDHLRGPGVTFWSAWVEEQLAGCGALKRLDETRCEIKSMRVADEFLRRGIGRAILNHLLAEARRAGYSSMWLETGSTEPFTPALHLYASAGFSRCGPFEDYVEDPFSVFMTRQL